MKKQLLAALLSVSIFHGVLSPVVADQQVKLAGKIQTSLSSTSKAQNIIFAAVMPRSSAPIALKSPEKKQSHEAGLHANYVVPENSNE